MSAAWNVWSLAPWGGGWIVVDVKPKKAALEGAARLTELARQHHLDDAEFVALPEGEMP